MLFISIFYIFIDYWDTLVSWLLVVPERRWAAPLLWRRNFYVTGLFGNIWYICNKIRLKGGHQWQWKHSKIHGYFLETFYIFLIKSWKMNLLGRKYFEIVHTDCVQVCANFGGPNLTFGPKVGQFPPQRSQKILFQKYFFNFFFKMI